MRDLYRVPRQAGKVPQQRFRAKHALGREACLKCISTPIANQAARAATTAIEAVRRSGSVEGDDFEAAVLMLDKGGA